MKTNSGQAIYEIILSIGIAAVVLVGIISASTLSVKLAGSSRSKAQAIQLAEDTLEYVRGKRDETPAVIFSKTPTAGNSYSCFSPDNDTGWSTAVTSGSGSCNQCPTYVTLDGATNIFKRLVTFGFDSANPSYVTVTVTVCWTDSQGYHEVNPVTRLSGQI